MVICLRCGWCCKSISPLVVGNEDRSVPEQCPHLEFKDTVASCKIYSKRPQQCKDEHMGSGDGYCIMGLLAVERGEVKAPSKKCMYCGGVAYGEPFCSEEHAKLFAESLGAKYDYKQFTHNSINI